MYELSVCATTIKVLGVPETAGCINRTLTLKILEMFASKFTLVQAVQLGGCRNLLFIFQHFLWKVDAK